MRTTIIYLLLLGWLCQSYGCEVGDKYQERPSQLMEDLYKPKNPQFTRYLHFPEYKIYYDLDSAEYIFQEDKQWKRDADLPISYKLTELWDSPIREMKYQGGEPQRQAPDYFPLDSLPERKDTLAL